MKTCQIKLFLPCYNPHEGWEDEFIKNALEVEKAVKDCGSISFVIINDASTKNFDENSVLKLKSAIHNLDIVSYPVNKGKGWALREGVRRYESDMYIYTDIDFPFGQEIIKTVADGLAQGLDVVVSSRGNTYFKHLPLRRKIATKIVRIVNKYYFRLPFPDTQAGLKAFNNKGRDIFLQTKYDSFLFDLEFVIFAKRQAARMGQVDVECRADIKFTDFKNETYIREFKNALRLLF
jgi:hypothetical protein